MGFDKSLFTSLGSDVVACGELEPCQDVSAPEVNNCDDDVNCQDGGAHSECFVSSTSNCLLNSSMSSSSSPQDGKVITSDCSAEHTINIVDNNFGCFDESVVFQPFTTPPS